MAAPTRAAAPPTTRRRRSTPIQLKAAPAPDLTVTAVSVPNDTVPGVPTTVTFTVQNVGETVARGPWTDQLVLLYGANFASSASLTAVTRQTDLQPGASYTVTAMVTLPALPDGPAEIAATTDAGHTVNEGGRYGNNTAASATFNTTHPDLVPIQVQAPSSIVSGQTLTVTWTTANQGSGPADPNWTETVTLVQGSTKTVIGTIAQTAPLAAGATVARRVDYVLPLGFSGAYQVVVTVNAGNTVTETAATPTDNTATLPHQPSRWRRMRTWPSALSPRPPSPSPTRRPSPSAGPSPTRGPGPASPARGRTR